jgi:hypothetical protein
MRTCFALVAALTLAGCSGASEQTTTAKGAKAPKMEAASETADGLKVERSDMNGDKSPDVWVYFKEDGSDKLADGTPKRTIVKKESDLNFDSKKDVLVEYDKAGNVEREVFDFDFDGVVDQENLLAGGRVSEKHLYAPQTSRIFIWKYYSEGQMIMLKRDDTGDGIADRCEEWFKGEKIVRTGRDINRDGDCDEWKSVAP